jgi:hypothetical protein
MKKLIVLTLALAFFSVGFSQDLQVRSIDISTQAKLNGKDVTNSLSGSNYVYTFADPLSLDFKRSKLQQITLTDSIVFASKNLSPGHEINLRIVGHGSIVCTLGFPASWKFAGTKPTSIAATKTALLIIRSYGTTDANVVATYSVEP